METSIDLVNRMAALFDDCKATNEQVLGACVFFVTTIAQKARGLTAKEAEARGEAAIELLLAQNVEIVRTSLSKEQVN